MGTRRSSGTQPLDETNLWWFPLGALVLLITSWAIAGFIAHCEPGLRGDCVARNNGIEWMWWVVFLAAMPTYMVVITGLTTRHWPPALGVALGGIAGGMYVLVQGQTRPSIIAGGILLVLAFASPGLTWHRRHGAHART